MRIWSLHPQYLDRKGLVALWREALLAKNVLEGKTKGYRNHPQLIRFNESLNPIGYINLYLEEVYHEAVRRNYKFNKEKFIVKEVLPQLMVTKGQIKFEYSHLKQKLSIRDLEKYNWLPVIDMIIPHPVFYSVEGEIEKWEKI